MSATRGRAAHRRQYAPILFGWREGNDHHRCGARDKGEVWTIDKPVRSDLLCERWAYVSFLSCAIVLSLRRTIDRRDSMQGTPRRVTLTASQAACLEAMRAGLDTKTKIAIKTKRDLKAAAAALETLRGARLVTQVGRYRWRVTKRGQTCAVAVVPEPKRRRGGAAYGRLVGGSAAERLLDALERPMRGAELIERLGVSRQRLHQIVVKLHALGRLRIGDEAKVLHVVARGDDRSVLLARDEERVLSALPEDAATNAPRAAAAAHLQAGRTTDALVRLCALGLVGQAGASRGRALYRLTREGKRHFQRRPSARRAKPLPLTVKSDRVRSVLSYIAERGDARIKDVRDALDVPNASMNALMQYLKRKGLVRKASGDLQAPYELTREGRDTLDEMIRRGER